jgi:hypothetical protein
MANIESADYLSVLEQTGVISFVPSGVSMWPFIKNRSQAVIIEKLSKPLEVFNVVLFTRPNGSYILHRVIDIDNDTVTVIGDSQYNSEKVNINQIVGVMTGFYKGKTFVSASDPKYIKKVAKWYKNGAIVRLRKKWFNFTLALKNKLKKGK